MKVSLSSTRLSLLAAGLVLALAGAARGGSFSSDFSFAPGGATAYGTAFVDSTGGAGDNGGVLKLTVAANDQLGSFIIDDLDPGERANQFLATFNLHMGNGTAVPADGISFNFATDLPNAAFNEEGAGSGLTIVFDVYDNTFDNNAEGPEFRIKYGGNLVTRRKIANQFQTGAGYVPVSISYTPAGTLTLVYNNIVMFTNMFVGGPLGPGARFGFGGRTGGNTQESFVDDLSITTATTTQNGFYVKGQVTPYPPVGISGANTFEVVLQDSGSVVDPNSVTMTFDGASVVPTVSKPSGITTISYTPPGLLLPSSVNHWAVNFTLSGNPVTLLYDFAVTNGPLWSLAPLSRSYLPLDADVNNGSTPLYRSIACNPLTQTNHLYVVSRTGPVAGLTINVLDANTGADLYQMNTNGISGGAIILINIVVADDGYIYAASMSATPPSPQFNVYRWANDDPATAPVLVFSGDPGAAVTPAKRWGDTLAVRGSGLDTKLILDCNANSMSAVLTPTDIYRTNFTATAYSHTYATGGTTIGRGLDFGPTNTYFLKKRSNSTTIFPTPVMPLALISLDTPPNTTMLLSSSAYYGEVGLLTVDWTRNLAAGIMFVTNAASPDHLVVYDLSNFASPLQIAQYDFPVTHQKNVNCIGKVVFSADKIFAVDGNNGIMAVPISPPTMPVLNIARSGGSAVLSWSNTVPGFILQSTPSLSPTGWNPVTQPVVVNGGLNLVTDTLGSTPLFYRLSK
jgi:hypothetical protein